MESPHSFFIPVMGTGFSIDTPIKVAKYGISSTISLVDDTLIEKMRQHYCGVIGEDYVPIEKNDEDSRARRITAYLNLVDRIVTKEFEAVKNSPFEPTSEITKYFELLEDKSPLKEKYQKMIAESDPVAKEDLQKSLREAMRSGSINVNIMTKLDRTNYSQDRKPLPSEFADALAALRGYAKSTLNSAIVFSAGINRRLYTYVEKFEDFYANASGSIKKKIILKVSDFRSSIIQGRFFAKKGLWVSEYRVESGLNCGGHAFPSEGFLMGPILEEFRKKKKELISNLHAIYQKALQIKNRHHFEKPHEVRITAQGGITISQEDEFLKKNYQISATGWGTPFLLVPDVTNVDQETLEKLCDATSDELWLSDASPLNVPFNNLKDSPSERQREDRVQKGSPGSPCPRKHLESNTEFSELPICVASRQYQKKKIEELDSLGLDKEEYQKQYDQVVGKSCICNDLGGGALIKHNIETSDRIRTAICPGPNLAYFSKITSLKEMVNHIYGRVSLLNGTPRSHMFIKELKMYMDYFLKEVKKCSLHPSEKQIVYLNNFKNNLMEGIEYYRELFNDVVQETQECREKAIRELHTFKENIEALIEGHKNIFAVTLPKFTEAL